MSEFRGRPARLERVWVQPEIYAVTINHVTRAQILAREGVWEVFMREWSGSFEKRGWAVGHYVVMPDHVHFTCQRTRDQAVTLSSVVGLWKQYTAIACHSLGLGVKGEPFWQKGFYDSLMRNEKQHVETCEYIWNNPVRAGLVEEAVDWPFLGVINELRM